MYERFTDRSRKVMQLAKQEAQRLNHEYISTEHVLLGLLKEGSGIAASVLKNLGVDLGNLRKEIERHVEPGQEMVTMGKLPNTPRTAKVIEFAMEESRSLGHGYVGTEHLLMGLVRETEGPAAKVIEGLGLSPASIRNEILNLLGANVADGNCDGKITIEPVTHYRLTCNGADLGEFKKGEMWNGMIELLNCKEKVIVAGGPSSWILEVLGSRSEVNIVTATPEIAAKIKEAMSK